MLPKDSTLCSLPLPTTKCLFQRPFDIWTCTIFVSICCQFTPKGDVVNHGVDRIPIVAVLSRGSCCFTLRQNDIFLLHQPSKPKWFYGLHVYCTGPHKKVCLSFHRLTTLKCQQREAYPPRKLTYPLAAGNSEFMIFLFPFGGMCYFPGGLFQRIIFPWITQKGDMTRKVQFGSVNDLNQYIKSFPGIKIKTKHMTRWLGGGFNYLLVIFTPILGEMIEFDSCFSIRLKPPTRWISWINQYQKMVQHHSMIIYFL